MKMRLFVGVVVCDEGMCSNATNFEVCGEIISEMSCDFTEFESNRDGIVLNLMGL